MTRLPRSPGSTLVLRLNQETIHRLHIAVLATMRPALDSASHRVPRTKPNCLLHTWRPHWQRPFALILHLHQPVKPQPAPAILSQESVHTTLSITHLGSNHPPVLEPYMVLTRARLDRTYHMPRLGSTTPTNPTKTPWMDEIHR
jgi:hypothetical protein